MMRVRRIITLILIAVTVFSVAIETVIICLARPQQFLQTLILLAVADLLVILVFYFTIIRKLNKDMRGGCKKVITAPVESQRTVEGDSARGQSDVTSYKITVGGKEYSVPIDMYMKLHPGDVIELHVAPHSGRVFQCAPVKS